MFKSENDLNQNMIKIRKLFESKNDLNQEMIQIGKKA